MTHTTPMPTKPAAHRSKPTGKLDLRQLVSWLSEDGIVAAEAAASVAKRFGSAGSAQHPLIRLGLANLTDTRSGKPLTTDALVQWLAARYGLRHLRIDPLKVDVARVSEVMSIAYAESRRSLPVQVGPTDIIIATCEPFDAAWVSDIESHTRRKITLVLAHPDEIARYTSDFYNLASSVRAAQKTGEAASASNFEQLVELGKSNRQLDANDQGVVQVVDWLWQYAYDQRASDIHLEPRRDTGLIRFRIDGVMHNVHQMPMGVMNAMTARIKLLGRMDVVERRRPQDGRIKTRRPEAAGIVSEVEMRLSTMPTAFGEKVVMRIFDPGTVDKPLEALGFSAAEAERWHKLIGLTHGIILVTGPTGSGKTTTLYSTLKRLASDEVNICTVEDPIEMVEASFNQTQVQPALDLGFADGLRALMRQDPDIIMVGEIRDLETAEMAIQASLTGHLVFSTVHTNDAASTITRLIDLGVPPYLVTATVVGVLAQRLTRTLCPACKAGDPNLTPALLAEMAAPWRFNGEAHPYRAVGCLTCRGTGYRGRAALYELMLMSDAATKAIHPTLDAPRLRRIAISEGLRPLRVAGLAKVAEGVTTLEEVLRCTPDWQAMQ